MNPSDRLRQIAAAHHGTDLGNALSGIAVQVARMERTLDEIVTDAMEDVQTAYNAAQASRPCAVIIRPEWWQKGAGA